jgi:hypothetical protein
VLTDNLQSKVKRAPVNRLPNELFYAVFDLLDTDTLFTCRDVCKPWRDALTTSLAVWKRAPSIKGTLEELDAKWRRLKSVTTIDLSLTLWICSSGKYWRNKPCQLQQRLMSTEIVEQFPQSLREFHFKIDLRCADYVLWRHIFNNSNLKILHWTSSCEYIADEDLLFSYPIDENSPPIQALCRLDEFAFDVHAEVCIDDIMLQMVSQVKRLYLRWGLSRSHLLAILSAAESTMEKLVVSFLSLPEFSDTEWYGQKPDYKEFHYVMEQLRHISMRPETVGILSITAPNLTYAHFYSLDLVDWTLLDSCRSRLRTLKIHLDGMKTKGRFAQELFVMPKLECLYLHYSPDYMDEEKKVTRRYEDYSTTALWQAVLGGDTTRLSSSLPKLKNLTILHDPLLNEATIIRYIELRKEMGQPALQDWIINLADHCSHETSRLEALRMSSLKISRFDEWKDKFTPEWLHKTILKQGLLQHRQLERHRSQ